MNKKTVILLVMLILLVLVALTRWNGGKWEVMDGFIIHMQYDRLSSLSQYTVLSAKEGIRTLYANKYLTFATNLILSACIMAVVVALLVEAKKE